MVDKNTKKIFLNSASKKQWSKIGVRRKAGILIPLFSIYSQKSLGIGEFGDLKLFVDWCVKTGNSIIQLLPLNETGMFCPYDSESSFALEPVYISLRLLPSAGNKDSSGKLKAIQDKFPAGGPHVNYGIKKEKLGFLWKCFLEKRQAKKENF